MSAKATENFISPRSAGGALLWSVIVHTSVVTGVVAWMKHVPMPQPEQIIEMEYQTFDNPPTDQPHHVVHSDAPKVPPDTAQTPDNSPHEMQDQKSDVAGTQTEKKEVARPDDGTYANTPYYRIKPKYPRAALVSGVEGWVMLIVDITEQGEVENIRVADGEQKGMFEGEARRAVEQWKYKPYLDQTGKAIRKENEKVLVTFKLNEVADGSTGG